MGASAPALTVVLPVYNERESLPALAAELEALPALADAELVAVDDASTDGSLDALRGLARREARWRVLRLPRHSGQSAALVAGWRAARGPVVVTLDADGQNDPADIPVLLAALDGSPGLVAAVGVRIERSDGWWKRAQSRVASLIRDAVTGHRVRDTGCGLKVMRREALLRLPPFDGVHRFLPTLLARDGGGIVEVPVRHRPRQHGRTKYGMWNRAARGLRDALGVRWLTRRRLPPDWEEVT